MQRILVVKLADIGDVLTATPALRALRRTFPHAQITALIPPHCREVLDGTPFVDRVLLFDKQPFDAVGGLLQPAGMRRLAGLAVRLRQEGFDAMLLMHHLTTPWGAKKYASLALASGAPVRAGLDNGRGWFLTHRAPDLGFGAYHEVEYCNQVVQLLGADPDYGPLAFPVGAEDTAYAQALLAPYAGRPRIALHPGSGSYSLARRWPLERYIVLAQRLAGQVNATFVVVGGQDERPLGDALSTAVGTALLDLTGRTTLRQLGAVLQECDLLVSNDSGVMHIATAVETPVVALFGPSNHRAWGPWTPSGRRGPSIVLRAELPCSPCFYTGHSLGTPEGCPERTCLQLITPEQVTDTVERHLALSQAPLHSGRPGP